MLFLLVYHAYFESKTKIRYFESYSSTETNGFIVSTLGMQMPNFDAAYNQRI